MRYCRRCQSTLQPCAVCKGTGQVYRSRLLSGGSYVTCPACGGSGKVCPNHGSDYA